MTIKSTFGRVTEPAGSDAQALCSADDTDQETRHASTIKPPAMMGVDARTIGSNLGVKAHNPGTARTATAQATTRPAIECSHSTVQRTLEGEPGDRDGAGQLMGPPRIPPAQPRESETGNSEEEHVGGRNHPDEMAVRAQALERNPVEKRAMGEHQTSFEQSRQETEPDHQEKQVERADRIMCDRSGSPVLRSIDSLA